MEWFSRTLNAQVEEGSIKGYRTKRGSVRINHLLFADDMLLFTNGLKNSVRNLISLIEKFCSYSGQTLNASKSKVIFPKKCRNNRINDVLSITGFEKAEMPLAYLGVPLFRGRVKSIYFADLEQKISDRIHGWYRNLLSMGGRVSFVNSVLNSIGRIHSMMVLPIPACTLKRISSMLNNFIWDHGDNKHRHWAGWHKIARPKNVGGLGVKDPVDVQLALHGKLAWNFLQQKSLWARYAKDRFRENERGSVVWNGFNHLISCVRENCYWKIGAGESTIGELCRSLHWPYPAGLDQTKVKQIIHSNEWNDLILWWPWAFRDKMRGAYLSSGPETLAWIKANDGVLTTMTFWKDFQTVAPEVRWFNHVWNKHLPPKVSCFLWRIIHKAIPTDDAVSNLGICIVSICSCCSNHSQESLEHLFFGSNWSRDLWRLLSNLFGKPVPGNMEEMLAGWFDDSNADFVEFLGSATAAIGLWNIWKARNKARFEDQRMNWLRVTLHWVPRIANLINKEYREDHIQRLLLQYLRVQRPG